MCIWCSLLSLQWKLFGWAVCRTCVELVVNGKFSLEQATKAQRWGRCITLLFLQPRRKVGVGGQRHAPAALPPGKTRYPLCRRLGGSQGWSGRARKISPPPGFALRTVQPVASRYTWRRRLKPCMMGRRDDVCDYMPGDTAYHIWRPGSVFIFRTT